MGFCTPKQHAEFIRQVPMFEQMLVNDGISLTKLWFSVSPSEQRTRFTIRQVDPDRGQGRRVRVDGHRDRAVDGGQEQRQEARTRQRDAPRVE
jgi:hypothetical protein